jgi:hypothetical protein
MPVFPVLFFYSFTQTAVLVSRKIYPKTKGSFYEAGLGSFEP